MGLGYPRVVELKESSISVVQAALWALSAWMVIQVLRVTVRSPLSRNLDRSRGPTGKSSVDAQGVG